ncbi:DNA polymerase III subunit beta [Corynebacterium kozikiae]|uniref:DNA polymerase III subunit beta n=1 Tax=Corynebacterium kozikiae TaxID=2968469 RepID=UPI00211C5A73|nr:DNA polymerase III subunit beta [Corynebacterium sp. 76QC2CO]MCQ9343748.1 DNA polymerase III subunit beta [Corynebacterium sp. 76QC2CO]
MEHQELSFRVEKDELASAVAWVARSLPTNPTQPVLRGMLITATFDGLELAGFDYEVSTKVTIPAEVKEAGQVAVGGKLLAEIVSVLPSKPVEFSVNGQTLLLVCGSARFELPVIPLDDYPPLPKLPAVTGAVDPSLFNAAVSQVAVAAGRDDTLQMLTGIHIEIDGEQVTLTATDRFRLATRKFQWVPAVPDAKANLLVPAKNLAESARSLNSSEPVEIAVGSGESIGSEGLFGLHVDARQTTARMLDADFPNVAPLFPKHHTSMATVEISALVDAIRRVSLVAGRNSHIRMQFNAGELILSATGQDAGHAEEYVPCAYTGQDDFIIAFNPSYLRDGLSVIPTDRVVFGFTESSRPAILIPEPEELPQASEDGTFPAPETDYSYLLMSVRLPG